MALARPGGAPPGDDPMNQDDKITRREMLGRSLMLGAVATVGTNLFLSACGGSAALDCSATAGLSADDIATRTANQYVEASTDAAKKCTNCNFWQGQSATACGACTVVKGTINPNGYCRLWVAKQA
jgi:High potential iron-sulfur protein